MVPFTRRSDGTTQQLAPAERPAALSPCGGYIFRRDAGGVWRFSKAHRGRRNCDDQTCRHRYWRRLYTIALAGLEELTTPEGAELPKFLTVTLPGESIDVPVKWFLDEQRRAISRHARRWGKAVCELPASCPLVVDYEGATYPVGVGGIVKLPPRGRMAYRYIAQCWNRFMTSVRRAIKKESGASAVFWYLRVVEEQKRKAPHYHALVYAPFIAQARLSALAEKAGLGSVVDIRAADIKERAGYAGYAAKVANYATKTTRGQQVNPTPKGMRFYTRSQTWAKAARTEWETQRASWKEAQTAAGSEWKFVPARDLARSVRLAVEDTGLVADSQTGEVYASDSTQAAA